MVNLSTKCGLVLRACSKKSLVIDLWLQFQIFYDLVNQATRGIVDHATSGKLRDKSVDESWEIIEGLVLYDNESWNRNLAKLVKAISLPHDVPMNKIISSCEICSDPHDTQYCMKNPEQTFVDYSSSRTDKARDARLSKFEADFKQQQSKVTNKIDTLLKVMNDRMTGALPIDTVKNPELNVAKRSSSIKVKDEEPGNMYSAGAHNLSPADRISTSTGIVVSCFMCLQMAKLH
ncbi:hypothetical protein Tco_0779162 [Tanacetum coccineum]